MFLYSYFLIRTMESNGRQLNESRLLGDLGDKRGDFFKEIKSEWAKHKETIK